MIDKMLSVSIKNRAQPLHWHDLLEINLVLEGEMDVVRNNKTFHVGTGELMVLNRDDVHSVSSKSENLLYVQLHLEMEHYNQYIPEIWTALFYCSPEENDLISRNFKAEMKSRIGRIVQLMQEQSSNVDAEKKIIYHCIEILSNLKMGFVATLNKEGGEMSEEQMGRLWKVIDYMYDNHNRKLTLHEVAQQIYVSDDYLSKLLKKQHGMGFEEFLGFIRAEMSIRLLLNTDMSITNISSECGFSAPKYYNAAFVRTYGCTPAQYRKNNKNNFLMEKQHKAASAIYDEGTDKNHAFRLLKKYEVNYNENNAVKKTIEIDLNQLAHRKELVNQIRISTHSKDIWSYGIEKMLAEIQMPCMQPDQNIFIWQEQKATKILVVHPKGVNEREYIIKIAGLDPAATYLYCRRQTMDVPASLKRIVDSGTMRKLDSDIIDHIFDMTYEYGEIALKAQLYMNIELKEEQAAKITIQKIE